MIVSCLPSVYMCFTQNLVILEHCQQTMSTDWSENPPRNVGAPEFWCPGTKSLVPFQADQQVFCFNLKNGLQKYEYILFVKCLYVFYTKPGYIETLPAQNEHALLRKPSKKRQGHQSSGARAPEVWCPSKLTNRFFVLISRMGFRTMMFCCLPSVSMCSTQNLVLAEHGQHEWACSDEKTLKK